jgi:DNA-binding transcriptional LysR family regulator
MDGRLLPGATVLVSVVEAGTIVRAAGSLNLTASAVSRAVARLEERVGVRLLDRTTRSLSLTDEGRNFYEAVKPHLAAIEEAALSASGTTSAVRGRLRVNIEPFLARVILAKRMPEFLEKYPKVNVELLMRESTGDLVIDGFDLALKCGDPPPTTFIARKVLETRVITVASPKYIARFGKPRSAADLQKHNCITLWDWAGRRPYQWELHKGRRVVEATPSTRFLVSDVGAMIEACVAGTGVAQILALGNRHLIKSGALVELFPDWSDERFPVYIVHPSRRHQPAKVKAFIDFATECIRQAAK